MSCSKKKLEKANFNVHFGNSGLEYYFTYSCGLPDNLEIDGFISVVPIGEHTKRIKHPTKFLRHQ